MLHADRDLHEPEPIPARLTDESISCYGQPVYYDYKPGRWIRYWFFYAYDVGGSGFNHEGDWEGVTIHLNGSTPTEIRLDRHKSSCGETVKWSDMQFENGHVVVYSAEYDHATYKSAGIDYASLVPPCHPFLDDVTAKGQAWHTWQRLGNVRKQDWYGFGGAWGEPGTRVETTGPLGPSQWKNAIPDGW